MASVEELQEAHLRTVAVRPDEINEDVWLIISELWHILRYPVSGGHKQKLKAAKRLQEFIDARTAHKETAEKG